MFAPQRLLLLDTAGPAIGVAAWVGDEVVFLETTRQIHRADGWLGPTLAAALAVLGDVGAIGVSVGPGAFTGLRVGVATALGLAIARDVPVRPLSSLALRACKASAWRRRSGGGPTEALVLLDAKKDRFYLERFDIRPGLPRPLAPPRDVSLAEAVLGPPAAAVGEGVLVGTAMILAAGHLLVEDPGESPVKYGLDLLRDTADHRPEQVTCAYLRGADAVPRP